MLNRLYSETGAFDEIRFQTGLNIILGKYSGTEKSPDINGIGKSSVVRLVDLAFLSSGRKREFTTHKYNFLQRHSFSLEFTIQNTRYTLKRLFHDLSKAYFAETGQELVEYREEELKEILADRLFRPVDFDLYFESGWYHNLMRFYIKDDLDSRARRNPVNFIHEATRAPYLYAHNLFLLGLPNKSIFEFDAYNQELKQQQQVKKKLEEKLFEDTGKNVVEFNHELLEIERKIAALEESLKEYQFFKTYQDVERELIEIAKQVGEKNALYNKFSKELEYYQHSYQRDVTEIDLERVTKLYEDVNAHLARFVKYELQKILTFRTEIAENRQKFLQQRVQDLNTAMQKLLMEIDELDRCRSKLLKFLDEREALDSLKNTYNSLIEQKAMYERVAVNIQKIREIELEISETKEKISALTTQVIREIQANESTIKAVKLFFYDIIAQAIFVGENTDDVKFDIHASSLDRTPATIDIDIPKSKSLGKFVFKLLAYDLTVFLHALHTNRNLPHFLFHDGVFHGVGQKTVMNVLNYMYRESLQSDLQYIITLNEHEMYIPSEKEAVLGKLQFDVADRTIATFEDTPERMFFKQSF